MTKDEFIKALDDIVANPDKAVSLATDLRRSASDDYDTLTQLRTVNESLTDANTKLTKDLQEMKDLNLKLFMSQPNVAKPDSTEPEPPKNDAPKADAYDSIDALIADMHNTK